MIIQHYFKIALRNLLKYKMQSAISIVGLAVGITVFIFGIHWLHYETSYDSFYPDADLTYRIYNKPQEGEENWGNAPTVLASFMEKNCPEVTRISLSSYMRGLTYRWEDKKMEMPNFMLIDTTFLQLFPQKVIYGDIHSPLLENDIIITEQLARRYWNNPAKAVGVVMTSNLVESPNYTIKAVIQNPSSHSNFQYDGYILRTWNKPSVGDEKAWQLSSQNIYFQLTKGTTKEEFSRHLRALQDKNKNAKALEYTVIGLNEVHYTLAEEQAFSIVYIKTFAFASALLLFCVLFNFINLLMNRFCRRVREMQLRKTIGSEKRGLFFLLFTELGLQAALALLISGCFIEVSLPFFNQIFHTVILAEAIWPEYAIVSILFLSLLLLVAALPVGHFIHISTHHSLIEKSSFRVTHTFRRISILIQLMISLFFFTSTYILHQQLNFIKNTDLGFCPDNLIEVAISPYQEISISIREEIRRLPMVEQFSNLSNPFILAKLRNMQADFTWEGKSETEQTPFLGVTGSKNVTTTLGLTLTKGRTFRAEDWNYDVCTERDFMGCPIFNKVLLNATAARATGLKQPVGSIIRIAEVVYIAETGPTTFIRNYEVIGIVQDYYPTNLKSLIPPVIIFQFDDTWHNYLRVTPGTEKKAIQAINELTERYKLNYGEFIHAPQTMNQRLDDLNKSESATLQLFSILSLLCIFISLFGIYSISTLTIEQRKKEIAVRKVLGASAREIVTSFLREYMYIVCLAGCIAFPITYYIMSQWLEQYAYHIPLRIGLFLVIIAITAALVAITIFEQVIRAARQNPAEVIKSE